MSESYAFILFLLGGVIATVRTVIVRVARVNRYFHYFCFAGRLAAAGASAPWLDFARSVFFYLNSLLIPASSWTRLFVFSFLIFN